MDTIVAPITQSLIVESNKPDSIVIGSTDSTVNTTEIYNVVVEVLTPTTIVSGQPGPAGPVGLSEDSVAYAKQTDFVGDDVIYKGEAEAGSAFSSSVWRIRKIVFVGDDVSEIWADGNTNFDNIWDNRASLNYF